MRIAIAFVWCILAQGMMAQDLRDIRQKYPGEDLVMLSNKTHYRMRLDADSILVDCKESEDWIYLSEKGSMMKKEGWFSHSGFRELGAYEAYTLTAKGKKLGATEFKTTANTSDGVFYDDSKLTSFKFPGLSEGAVTHQEYEIRFRNPYLLTPHYFTRGLPTAFNELKITFPKNIRLRYVLRGVEKERVVFKEEKGRQETTWRFTVENMPRENRYPDAPDHPHWATHVVFYVEAWQGKDGAWHNFLSDPADLYALYEGYTRNINKTLSAELTHITDSVTSGKSTPAAKAAAIYRWAQDNVKYVAFEQGMEGFIPRDASLVCSRRYGDCKDFSSILTMMLRHAGLKAYYTWIGTRDLPYTYAENPTPVVDNHMICTLDLDGKLIFLDGTDNTCVFGWPSSGIQGKEALIGIDAKQFRIVTVPVPESKDNRMLDTTFVEFTPQGVRGTIHQVMHGYYAMDFISRLSYQHGKERDEFMKSWLGRGSNKFSCKSYRITDSSATGDQIGIIAEFEIPDYGKTIGDDRFINLHLQKHFEHEEIDFPKRKIPVSYRFRYETGVVTMLKRPEGYKTEFLPEAKSFENETWGYRMQYREDGQWIVLDKYFTNNHLYIFPDRFESWNKVLEVLLPQYKASVSLTK
jgi:transglutaminase-like putative cysteine protease